MIDGIHTLNVLTEVAEERHAQDEQWGLQDFPFHHPVDIGGHALVGQPYERWAQSLKDACDARRSLAKRGGPDRRSGLLVLLEEVAEAAAETDPRLIRAELLQVAAVAVKLIEALDRAEGKKHGPGCELGTWHGGECRPSALLRALREATPAPVPETFRRGSFNPITRETVAHTIRELMAEPYKPGVPKPHPLMGVPLADAVRTAANDMALTGESLIAYDVPPPVPPARRPAVIPHPYNGSGRLHGICRCGNGSGDQIHRCPDCEHGFHTAPCRELTGTGAPGDVDECGCRS